VRTSATSSRLYVAEQSTLSPILFRRRCGDHEAFQNLPFTLRVQTLAPHRRTMGHRKAWRPFQADFSVLSQRRGAPADAGFYYVSFKTLRACGPIGLT